MINAYKEVRDALPNELSEILNSSRFDDEAGLLIESVMFTEQQAYLTFSIRFYDDSPQTWQINITGLEDEQIIRNWSQEIEVYKKHILLLEHHDVHSELYFNGTTANSDKLFIDIFQSLVQLSDNRAAIEKYILSPDRIRELSQQGYGLFARGPKTIMSIYGKCLVKQNIKPIFIGDIEPATENKSLKVLLLGESHFIAHNFEFTKLC